MSSNIAKLDFLANLNEQFDNLVYLGCGASGHLPELITKIKNDIFIFEPESSFYKSLKSKTKKLDNVNVFNDWVIPDADEEEFAYIFNNPRFNSICSPKNLLSKNVNLKLVERKKCDGKRFSSLLNVLPLISYNHNLLIMNLQGGERKILANVTCNLHSLFQTLVLVLPPDGYYDCADDIPKLLGFTLERTLNSGSDRILLFYKDIEKVALIVENTNFKNKIQELKDSYQAASNDIEKLQNENQELIKRCELKQQSIDHMKKENSLLVQKELKIQRRYYRLLNKTNQLDRK